MLPPKRPRPWSRRWSASCERLLRPPLYRQRSGVRGSRRPCTRVSCASRSSLSLGFELAVLFGWLVQLDTDQGVCERERWKLGEHAVARQGMLAGRKRGEQRIVDRGSMRAVGDLISFPGLSGTGGTDETEDALANTPVLSRHRSAPTVDAGLPPGVPARARRLPRRSPHRRGAGSLCR